MTRRAARTNRGIPDYLTYYFRDGQKPFEVLTDLEPSRAEKILENDTQWRGDGTYLGYRKNHERLLRELFIEKGGHPSREHPIYAILGESPTGPHDLENEYARKIRIPLSVINRDDICFTYPDSLYEVPLDDLGRLYLERSSRPTVFTMERLDRVIATYRVYEINNHYLEAQIWNDRLLEPYADARHWLRCRKRDAALPPVTPEGS
jgi:hypothetical protein